MIHINNLEDCSSIDNPELYREVASYLLYCRMELQEYEDEEDIDLNFMVLAEEDLAMLSGLGPPEEIVQINIKESVIVQTIYRLVYVNEVLFIPAELPNQFSF